MTDHNTSMLIKLGDQGQTVADPAEDIRGRTVTDMDGKQIGRIVDLLIDTQERRVRFLRVEHGGILGFGATATFIPVDAVSDIGADDVQINQSSANVADSPPYDPELGSDGLLFRTLRILWVPALLGSGVRGSGTLVQAVVADCRMHVKGETDSAAGCETATGGDAGCALFFTASTLDWLTHMDRCILQR